MNPKIAILRTDGTNCDEELSFAFKYAGGVPEMVHINELKSRKKLLTDYQILALPGGFTYGDDILSGKILANELIYRVGDAINTFINKDKLVLGVCNGFQVLVRAGLLPWPMNPAEDVGLVYNNSGSFECRWIRLKIETQRCIFTKGLEGRVFDLPVAHGEGKFIVRNDKILQKLFRNKHIVTKYVDDTGIETQRFPANPNGSIAAIAGITDISGRIFGLMPHPERNILAHQHPHNHQNNFTHQSCLPLFKNAIEYFA